MDVVPRRERGDAPPILTLLDLIEEHRPAFEYDWRTRFHCRFDVPGEMTWGEAWRLTIQLVTDPSSRIAASVSGWDHPASPEWLVLADLYDAFVMANTDAKKYTPTPYPRPWDEKPQAITSSVTYTVAEYRALRARLEKQDRPRDARGRFVKSP